MTITDEYLEYQKKYEDIYGGRTIVLMQVGSFFEAYGVDNENENCNADNLNHLSDILNIQKTKKNKNILEISRKNPLMIGVPTWSIDKYTQILTNHNFTIVMIEQISEPPNCKRGVTNIISPGTNIEVSNNSSTNW